MKRQKGMALAVSLIILIALTILSLSSMNNSLIELKSSSNAQEKSIACKAAHAGLDTVMCLADKNRSGTTSNNPLDNDYSVITGADTFPNMKYNWSWDKTYDSENVSPFTGVTQASCSINNGVLDLGLIGSSSTNLSQDLKVAVRRLADGPIKRSIKGSSIGKIACHNYIIDSRYDFSTSGANAKAWAEICRQVPTGK